MDRISEQAARWVVLTDRGPLQSDEQRELESWLAENPRHLGAYVRAKAYWGDLDRLAVIGGDVCADAAGAHRRPSGLRRRELLAGGIATLAVGGGLSWYLLLHKPSVSVQNYASGIGKIKKVTLTDGSTLLLNTQSVVRTQFTERQRLVQLLSGEVLFEVAHDPAKPFIVGTERGAVRAVGTAFDVRIDSHQVDVTVTEGVVEVANSTADLNGSTRSTSFANKAYVSALQQAVITGNGIPDVQAMTQSAVDDRLAWREGMLYFDGESLQTAVSEINRYHHRQIIVDDLTLAAKPIVGVFQVTDLDGFAAAAAAALDARVVKEGSVIRLDLPVPKK